MMQEMKLPFDVIDPSADFGKYRLLILPDEVRLDAALATRLAAYVRAGGRAILSDQSGLDAGGGAIATLDLGFTADGTMHDRKPFYASTALPKLPEGSFVVYGKARAIKAAGAEVVAHALPSYFNRTWAHFCSHQHAPDIPGASPMGPLVTVNGGIAYIATPIFATYHASGQPLYRNLVAALIARFLPDPILQTDMATTGRASVSVQGNRHILHLWHGAPTVRGRGAWGEDGKDRVMEMIEDVQSIGPVTTRVRLPKAPSRVFDALTGADIACKPVADGYYEVQLDYLRIHRAVVFEGSA